MTAFPSYSTGTVSIANGATTVTGAGGANWSGANARSGDLIVIDGHTVLVVDVVSSTSITVDAWPYTTVAGVTYEIYKTSPLRFAGGDAMADVSTLVAVLNTDGFYVFVDSDLTEPDPSYGEENQFALQPSTGKLWLKTGGVWVFQGVYKGFQILGVWSSVTAYQVGDVVSLNGTSYVALAPSTNQTPPNATYWQVLANVGATAGIVQAYSSTTTDADPGAATFRLNNATPASATAAYLDNTQVGGATVSGIFDLWDDSTNVVRGVLRMQKTTDVTVWAQWQVTGSVVDGTGYRKLTLANGAGSGAFTAADEFAIMFFRAGDAATPYGGTSTTSLAIGTGTKVFTTQAGLPYLNGARVRATSASGTTNWMEGIVTYSGTTLTMTSDKISGSGTKTDWNLNIAGEPGAGDLTAANNLSEIPNDSAARLNLGINQAVALAAAFDLNTLTDPGTYTLASGNTNGPFAGDFFVQVNTIDSNNVLQVVWYRPGGGDHYYRVRFSGTWGAWIPVLTGGSLSNALSSPQKTQARANIDALGTGEAIGTGDPLGSSQVATQANQEAASSTTLATTPGRQHFHPSAAKMWGYVFQTGTMTLGSPSYGISSITDLGAGDTRWNMSVTFSSTTYVAASMAQQTVNNTESWNGPYSGTTTTYRSANFDSGGVGRDTNGGSATFGDL